MLFDSSNSGVSSGIQQLRRVRRARTQYEKLQRPADIMPGEPIPSIEGWVVFLTHLPPFTTVEDIQDLFVNFKESDPDYFGTIREVKIPLDKDCQCPGYALVELENKEGYYRAINELNNTRIPFADDDTSEMPHTVDIIDGEEISHNNLLGVFPAFLAENDDDENNVMGNVAEQNGSEQNETTNSGMTYGNNGLSFTNAELPGSKRTHLDDDNLYNRYGDTNNTLVQDSNAHNTNSSDNNKKDNTVGAEQISDSDDNDYYDNNEDNDNSDVDADKMEQNEEARLSDKRHRIDTAK